MQPAAGVSPENIAAAPLFDSPQTARDTSTAPVAVASPAASVAAAPDVNFAAPVHSPAAAPKPATPEPAPTISAGNVAVAEEIKPAPTFAVATQAPLNLETTRPVMAAQVDQIDDTSSLRSTPRPARRRNRDTAPSEPLVFIETVAAPTSAAAIVPPAEEEAPRRRTPRPRGPRATQSEPLLFVETKAPATGVGEDKGAM